MKRVTLEAAVGLFMLIGLICVGYLTIKLGKIELLGDDHYKVVAKFYSVSGLKPGASVEVAGVEVGQVDSIILDKEKFMAKVLLKIQNGVELSEDVIASVKTAGLIGDKFIKLSPGGSDDIIPPGGEIFETESSLDIEELVGKYVFGGVE
ncbi:MAG: outer membrane lipid asymmetry maintenance protein MlaD [Desulfobacteraceae bacterium]|nr:outer membrane lipid asymmetry maintenance protein MlaD [Desulfobacteraceae bacterium]